MKVKLQGGYGFLLVIRSLRGQRHYMAHIGSDLIVYAFTQIKQSFFGSIIHQFI